MINYLLLILSLTLIGCNSKSPILSPISSVATPAPEAAPDTSVSVSGFLTGLTSGTITLSNGSETLAMTANGVFTFPTKISLNSSYNVLIVNMPATLNCIVAGGSGTATQNVTTVQIKCGSSSRFLVSGTISGLTSSGLELKLSVGAVEIDAITIAENSSSLLFNGTLANAASYLVTISSQPAGKACVLSNGTGTVSLANITNISISCVTNGSITITGTVNGLVSGESISIGSNAQSGTKTLPVSFGTTSYSFPMVLGHRAVIEVLLFSSSVGSDKYCYFTTTKLQKYFSSVLTASSSAPDITCVTRNPSLCERGTAAHDVPDAFATKAICDSGYLYFIGNFSKMGKHIGAGSVLDIGTATPTPPPTQDKIIGTVNKILPDGSGGWYVGGEFSRVGDQAVSNLVHFFSDMTLDPNFNVKPNYAVRDLHLDGTSLWVVGEFTTLTIDNGAVQNREGILKLDLATGSPILDDFYIDFPATSWGSSTGQGRLFAVITDASKVYISGAGYVTANLYSISSFAKVGLNPARNDKTDIIKSNSESLHLASDAGRITEFLWLSTGVSGNATYGLYKIDKSSLAAEAITISGHSPSSTLFSRSVLLGTKLYSVFSSGVKVTDLAAGTNSFSSDTTIAGLLISGSILGIATDGDKTICLSGSSMTIGGGAARRGFACFDDVSLKSFNPAVDPSSAIAMSGTKLFFSSATELWNQTAINGVARINMTTGVTDSAFDFNFTNSTTTPDFDIQGSYLYMAGNFPSFNTNTNLKNLVRINTSTRAVDTAFYNSTINALSSVSRLFINATSLYYHSGTSFGSITLADPTAAPTTSGATSLYQYDLFTTSFIRAGATYLNLNLTPLGYTCSIASVSSQMYPLSDGNYLLSDGTSDPRKVDATCGTPINILPNVTYSKATPDVICGIESGLVSCWDSINLDAATTFPTLNSANFDVSKNALIYRFLTSPTTGLYDYSPHLQAFTIRP